MKAMKTNHRSGPGLGTGGEKTRLFCLHIRKRVIEAVERYTGGVAGVSWIMRRVWLEIKLLAASLYGA